MRRSLILTALATSAAATVLTTAGHSATRTGATAQAGPVFDHPTAIDNRYLPLASHHSCELRGTADDGTHHRSIATLLPSTRTFTVAGQKVAAAVIRDDDYENGRLVERTHDYYAQADDGTVYYLGEQTATVRGGRTVDTAGSWLYGRATDRLGVAMPASPKLGDQYRLEDVPGITIESDRVEELGLRDKVRGTIVTDVIRIQEFAQPDGEVEYKTYAPGIGVIAEYAPGDRARLVACR